MYVNVVCMATATLSKLTRTCMKGGKQATRPEYEARRLSHCVKEEEKDGTSSNQISPGNV